MSSTQIVLQERPTTSVTDSTFAVKKGAIPTLPAEGEHIVVKVDFISIDPAMRGWINEGKSYIEPVNVDDVMRAGAVGHVIASSHSKFPKGSTVLGYFGVQTHALSDGTGVTIVQEDAKYPSSVYLSAMGMTGMTSYFGILDVGLPKAGETVLVSGAAGAVGSLVGQIAKIKGCRVVGLCGSAEKCAYLKSLGFDEAINYKTEQDLSAAIASACPKGIDIYFDNVGGPLLDIVLMQIALHARIIICGAISQYNAETFYSPKNYIQLLFKRARMEGVLVFDYVSRYPEGAAAIRGWIEEGKLSYKEDVVTGIADFHTHLNKLFVGGNTGKLVLDVRNE